MQRFNALLERKLHLRINRDQVTSEEFQGIDGAPVGGDRRLLVGGGVLKFAELYVKIPQLFIPAIANINGVDRFRRKESLFRELDSRSQLRAISLHLPLTFVGLPQIAQNMGFSSGIFQGNGLGLGGF